MSCEVLNVILLVFSDYEIPIYSLVLTLID